MMVHDVRLLRLRRMHLALVLLLGACASQEILAPAAVEPSIVNDTTAVAANTQNAGRSKAMDAWIPGPGDTCTPERHASYSAKGPDGKLYPTWHPPVDPLTGCTFGHEHGPDPSASKVVARYGPVLFGLASEALDAFAPTAPRHEDHVGHKLEWQNDVPMNNGARCDVLIKLHQGTHSHDAFTNNLHEIVYRLACTNGVELDITMLTPIGNFGEFNRNCDRSVVRVNSNKPAAWPNSNMAFRLIPDRHCIDLHLRTKNVNQSVEDQALREVWQTHNSLRTANGTELAAFGPYMVTRRAARYFDNRIGPSLIGSNGAGAVARMPALCAEPHALGGTIASRAQSPTGCGVLRTTIANGLVPDWNSTASPFSGTFRWVEMNGIRLEAQLRELNGGSIWYSDPFGRAFRRTPFAGSIRQHFRPQRSRLIMVGRQLGVRDYRGPGVHAPN